MTAYYLAVGALCSGLLSVAERTRCPQDIQADLGDACGDLLLALARSSDKNPPADVVIALCNRIAEQTALVLSWGQINEPDF